MANLWLFCTKHAVALTFLLMVSWSFQPTQCFAVLPSDLQTDSAWGTNPGWEFPDENNDIGFSVIDDGEDFSQRLRSENENPRLDEIKSVD